MKKYVLLIVFFVNYYAANAQETYAQLSRLALETMWKAKDSTGYSNALNKYEEAFSRYPDSIDATGLYKASVLAGQLKDTDKAFYFLNLLKEIKEDNYGMPGWRVIVGKYSESEYKNLLTDVRWKLLTEDCLEKQKAFFQRLAEKEKEFYSIRNVAIDTTLSAEQLYIAIRNRNVYENKADQNYSISFAVNDSLKTSFFIHLPAGYNPEKKYPLLVFLHGAVRNNALVEFQTAGTNLYDWNRFYTLYAQKNDVILVFPKGSRQFNWMTPDDGFFMIPEMVKLIKKAINVDDDKVFISGHSNGATGSFSYLMKQPSLFAGFYGFNTYPKVFTGGTFVENIKNRSFINFSTDEDYYYPPNANDSMVSLMKRIHADYEEYRFNGFPHWLPQFDESEIAYQILYKDLIKRKRNTFPTQISWETDSEVYGNVDWIGNVKIDTLTPHQPWHQQLNFQIHSWLSYNDKDSLIAQPVDRSAFDFPKKSGKIKAEFSDNTFRIETSRVGAFRIYLSPEMIDIKKKVKVYVNGKLLVDKKMNYNKPFMISEALRRGDRTQVWINYIDIKL